MRKLRFIGEDSRNRPVYQSGDGRLWKDVSLGKGTPDIYSVLYNNFDGEPDMPIKGEYEICHGASGTWSNFTEKCLECSKGILYTASEVDKDGGIQCTGCWQSILACNLCRTYHNDSCSDGSCEERVKRAVTYYQFQCKIAGDWEDYKMKEMEADKETIFNKAHDITIAIEFQHFFDNMYSNYTAHMSCEELEEVHLFLLGRPNIFHGLVNFMSRCYDTVNFCPVAFTDYYCAFIKDERNNATQANGGQVDTGKML